ncbi:hypothetical protein OXX79_001087 [Metschnikowia pulcherrima]
MSDEFTDFADGDDSFIDQIFEELGTSSKSSKTFSPRVEQGALAEAAESAADRKDNGISLGLNETDNFNEEATEVDTPDEDKKDNPPMRTRSGRNSATPPMEIPSIFLTEGDRNRRILLRDQEIAKQLQEEDDKNSKRLAALESERHKILEELNDNGSNYVYSWKNDAQIIDDYVQKSLSHDPHMETSRQFYFFDNQERVSVGESFTKATPTLSIALRFLSGSPDRFLHKLEASSIPFLQFVFAALSSIFDLDSLAFVEKVACRACERWRTARSEETENDSENVNCPSITESMRAIGARLVDSNTVMQVSLRLVHYNNHLSLHVLRSSILFRVYLPRANTRDDFVLLFQYFFLACSDFHINNLERGYLQRTLVGPIFELFIDIWSLKFGAESFLDDVHSILSSVLPTLYADNEIQIQKKLEMHYNMLLNLLHSIPPSKPSAELVNRLVNKFLEFDNNREILAQVAKAIEKLSRLSVSSTVDGMEIDRAGIYKNFYKAELISTIIVSHVLVESPSKSQGLLACFERLQECKDSYQSIIGQLSFSTIENMRDKIRLTLFLSDTYHSLDYSATLLSKSDVLPDRDFFYEE